MLKTIVIDVEWLLFVCGSKHKEQSMPHLNHDQTEARLVQAALAQNASDNIRAVLLGSLNKRAIFSDEMARKKSEMSEFNPNA